MTPFTTGLLMGDPPPPPRDPTVTVTVSPSSRFGIGQSADFNVGNFAFNATAEGYGPDAFSYSIYRIDGSNRTSISQTSIPAFGNRNAEGRVSGLAAGEDITSRWYVTAQIPSVGLSGSADFEIGGYRQS